MLFRSSKWTGEYPFTLDVVLGDMIGRCRQLKLRAVGRERQLLTDFMVLLTARTMDFMANHGRHRWIAV